MGWSTWLTFRLEVNETLVKTSADFLAASPMKAAGYEYIFAGQRMARLLEARRQRALPQAAAARLTGPHPGRSEQVPIRLQKYDRLRTQARFEGGDLYCSRQSDVRRIYGLAVSRKSGCPGFLQIGVSVRRPLRCLVLWLAMPSADMQVK
jgi:hypothetical protein